MKIVDLTPKEIQAVITDLLEKEKFSEQPITNLLQKSVINTLLEHYMDNMGCEKIIKDLEELDKKYCARGF